MNILAINPGTNESAFVAWDGSRVTDSGFVPNDVLMAMLQSREAFVNADLTAIEMIASYGMAVGKEVFETCVWIGRIIERCQAKPRLIFRKDVKMHLCQSARAKDGNIRQALIDKHGVVGTKKNPGPLSRYAMNELSSLRQDKEIVDWMESNPFMAYRDRDPETLVMPPYVCFVDEDECRKNGSRKGICEKTLRACYLKAILKRESNL